MADSSSNVKLPLMIDQSQIDSSMQKVEKSVLSAVTNINNQLKKTPLNLDIALNVNSKKIYDLLQKQLALKIEQSELPPPSVSAGGGSSGGPSAIEQYGGHLKGATADFARFVTGPLRATFSDFRSAVETLTGHITTMADIYNQADQDSNLLQKINATDSKDKQDYVQFYYTSGAYGNKSLTIANDVYRQQENIRSGLLRKDPASIENYGDWSAIDQYSDPGHKILNQDKPGTRKEIGYNINKAVVNIGKVKEEADRIKAEAIALQQAASKIKDKAEVLNFTDPDQSKKLMQQYAEKVKQYDELIVRYNQKDLEYGKAMDHVRQVSGYNTHIQAAYSDPNYSVNWDINGLSAKTKKDALEKNDGLSATVGNANNAVDSNLSKATANMSPNLIYYQELRMALNQRFPSLMALQHEGGAYGTSVMDKVGAIGQIAGLSAWIASQIKKNKDDDDDHKGDDPPSGSATGSKESSTAPVTKPDAAGSKGANPSAGWLTKEQVDAEIEYQRRHQGFGLGMSMSGSGKEMAFIGESKKIPKAQKDYLIKQLITGNLETIEYMPAGGVGGLAAKELGGVVAGQIAKKGLRTAIAGGAAATVGINMAKAQQRAGSIVPLNHETLSKDNVDSTISKINNFLASTQHKNTNQPFAVQGQRLLTPMADIMNSQRYNQMAQSVNNNNQQFTANITVNSNAMNNHALAQDIKQAVSSYFTQWQRTANNTDPHRIQSVVIRDGNG